MDKFRQIRTNFEQLFWHFLLRHLKDLNKPWNSKLEKYVHLKKISWNKNGILLYNNLELIPYYNLKQDIKWKSSVDKLFKCGLDFPWTKNKLQSERWNPYRILTGSYLLSLTNFLKWAIFNKHCIRRKMYLFFQNNLV